MPVGAPIFKKLKADEVVAEDEESITDVREGVRVTVWWGGKGSCEPVWLLCFHSILSVFVVRVVVVMVMVVIVTVCVCWVQAKLVANGDVDETDPQDDLGRSDWRRQHVIRKVCYGPLYAPYYFIHTASLYSPYYFIHPSIHPTILYTLRHYIHLTISYKLPYFIHIMLHAMYSHTVYMPYTAHYAVDTPVSLGWWAVTWHVLLHGAHSFGMIGMVLCRHQLLP